MQTRSHGLRFGPLGENCVHICVDMQRLFFEETGWQMTWMRRVLPNVRRIASAYPDRTFFTRFIPAAHPGDGIGSWRRYYRRWAGMTLKNIGEEMAHLVPELEALVPPAIVIDKKVYSPWYKTTLDTQLRQRATDTLAVSGGETDVCVLARVLGAVDRGYRTVIVTDALCSSSDETHDALLKLYENRFSEQVEAATTDIVLANRG